MLGIWRAAIAAAAVFLLSFNAPASAAEPHRIVQLPQVARETGARKFAPHTFATKNAICTIKPGHAAAKCGIHTVHAAHAQSACSIYTCKMAHARRTCQVCMLPIAHAR